MKLTSIEAKTNFAGEQLLTLTFTETYEKGGVILSDTHKRSYNLGLHESACSIQEAFHKVAEDISAWDKQRILDSNPDLN